MKFGKRRTRKLIWVSLMLAILLFGYVSERNNWNIPILRPSLEQATLPAGTYRVVRIEDGDTATIDMNGTEERVRFIGVDTPEIQDPRKPVQCYGKAASNFTKSLIGANPLRLEADPENTNRDRYDRLLRYVYLPDGTFVNAEIIKQGYGFAYTSFPFTKKEEFKQLEESAKAEKRGLWGSCTTGKDEKGYNTINPETNP